MRILQNFLLLSLLLLLPFRASAAEGTDTLQSFSPTDRIVISELIVTGNKITRLQVIMRELMIHKGDTLPYEVFERAAERSRENLLNTGIFHFVNITDQKISDNEIIVVVGVTERWYVFPVPVFELVDRNLNEWIRSGDASRLNYGFNLKWDNFRGMNESLQLQFKWGYSQRFGIFYAIPFINKNQAEGLTFATSFTRNREVGYTVTESKQQLFTSDDEYMRKEFFCAVTYTQRKGFYNTGSFSVDYRYNSVADTVVKLNPDYLGQGRTGQELIVLTWRYRRDRRDFKIYPLKGFLFDFFAVKNGTGLLKNEPNLLHFQTQIKYFHKISERWYTASSVIGKLSGISEAPYFNTRGLGFNNELMRGYEYYVIPGQNYFVSKNTFKFALLPTKVIVLPINVLEKFRTIPYAFYLNANFDFGYVRDRQFADINPLANKWQYGYGFGMDYVTYYNLVFRIEYSWNKFGENGFFLHLTAPI